jgi:hypothetical protein
MAKKPEIKMPTPKDEVKQPITTDVEPTTGEETTVKMVDAPKAIVSSVKGAYKWATRTKFKGVVWEKGTLTPELSKEERNMLYTQNLITL